MVPKVSIGMNYVSQPSVSIYVDDELEITIVLDSKDSTEEFSVDVSGADFIRIEQMVDGLKVMTAA